MGICCKGILTLQKTRFGGPGKPSFWSVLDYGFYGFLWVLMSFYKFATFFFADCGEAASSKTRFLLTKKNLLFSQKLYSSKPCFDISTRFFFRDLVEIYIYIYFKNIYIYI